MTSSHAVRDFSFDISFGTETAAFAQHTRLQSFVAERLVSITEEVLRELDPDDGSVLRIEEMEIDLGSISEQSYYHEAEELFRMRLMEELRDRLGRIRADVDPAQERSADTVVSQGQSELNTVMWVLERGHLPWNAQHLDSGQFHAMLERVVEREGESFAQRLRASQHVAQLTRRLAWQIPESLLAAIVRPLHPATTLPRRREDWETLLLQLLEDTDEPAPWHTVLEQAVASGNAALLRAYWDRLFAGHAPLIESVVRELGIRRDVRHAMARGFPDEILGDILHLLEPHESEFIGQVTAHPEIFREAARDHRQSRADTRTQLWEFTFAYLLVDCGGRFNRRAYLESTVRRMAAHTNTTFLELLSSLVQVVGQVEAGSSLKTGMLSLLLELSEPETTGQALQTRGQSSLRRYGTLAWGPAFTKAVRQVRASKQHPSNAPGIAESLVLSVQNVSGLGDAWDDRGDDGELVMLRSLATLVSQAAEQYQSMPVESYHLASMDEPFNPLAQPHRQPLLVPIIAALRRLNLSTDATRELHSSISEVLWSWPSTTEHLRMQGDARNSLRLLDVLRAGRSSDERRSPTDHAEQTYGTSPVLTATAASFGADSFGRTLQQICEELEERFEHLGVRGVGATFLESLQRSVGEGRIFLPAPDRSMPYAEWASVIRDAADHHSFAPTTLLWELSMAIEHLETADKFASEVVPLLRDLSLPWSRALEYVLLSGDVRVLRLLLAEERVRSTIIDTMPPPLLCDIAELVEPSSAPLMRALAAQPEIFSEALPQENPSAVRRSLWEFTLAYAVVDRGSAFNARSYMTSVIGQLAAHHNLRYQDLVASLCDLVQNANLPKPLYAELTSILLPLNERLEGRAVPSPSAERSTDELDPRSLSMLLADAPHNPSQELVLSIERRLDIWLSRSASDIDAMVVQPILDALERLALTAPAQAIEAAAALDRHLGRQPDWLRSLLLKRLTEPAFLRRILDQIPEKDLNELFRRLAPSGISALASLASEITASLPIMKPTLKWQFLFLMAARGGRPVSEKSFVRQYVAWLAGRMGWKNVEALATEAARKLRSQARSTPTSDRSRAADLLELAFKRSTTAMLATRKDSRALELTKQPIFVRNAGQILAGPYLPRLFEMTGLLVDNKFRDEESAFRGVHLLQYMVDGSLDPPEHALPLNKILCGLQPGDPIRYPIALTDAEKDAVDGLLKAIITHWSALGNTSVQGLQQSFLQREGRLTLLESKMQLLVEPRAFDMLLDRLPWAYNLTKFSWMHAALYVEWR
jgi:hypothetical protein